MTFAAAANQDVHMGVVGDTTQRGAGGPSISQLFGLGSANQIGRTQSYAIRADISLNYNRLAFAQLDRTAAAGKPAIATGDGRGALALSQAGSRVTNSTAQFQSKPVTNDQAKLQRIMSAGSLYPIPRQGESLGNRTVEDTL